MTKRRYYSDAYTTTFDATVTRAFELGGRPGVILDQSYFYPTSGGQAHDTGTLNGIPVLDVIGLDDDVAHVLAEPLPKPVEEGTTVAGVIDWDRRYDHMQQHTGQHLLSQVFWQELGIESVSVHFGEVYSTLDVDAEALTDEQLAQVEDVANQIIWHNWPIKTYWVHEDAIDRVPLRLPPKVSGDIRIVQIGEYDWTACGGTHVSATGELGQLVLLKTERIRQQVRLQFVVGKRAMIDARQRRGLLDQAAQVLDNAVEEVPGLVAKLLERQKESDRQIRAMQEELLGYRAKDLLSNARTVGDMRLVTGVFPELDPAQLKGLAQALVSEPDAVALLCCGGGETGGEKGTAIFACGDAVDLNMGQILRDVLKQFGGGGGGRPQMAQGGGFSADVAADVVKAAAGMVDA